MIVALLLSTAFAAEPVAAPDPAAAQPAAPTGPDRSGPPAVVGPVLRDLPEPEVHQIGALTVHHVQVEGIRKVGLVLALQKGSVEIVGHPTEELQALGDLLGTTTAALDASELATLLDVQDIALQTSLDWHQGEAWATAPRERLETALDVLANVLTGEKFPGKDVKRWTRDRTLRLEVTGPSSQASVASAALNWAWLPPDHPYGARPSAEDAADVRSGRLRAQRAAWLSSSPLDLLVVGDVSWSTLEPLLTARFAELGAAGERPHELPLPPSAATRVIGVNMPEQDQVAIRMRVPAPILGDPDAIPAWALNRNLGGTFLSRLNGNLREEKGYTYGSRSSYAAGEASGSFTISVDVPEKWLGSTIVEIEGELQELVDGGVSADELAASWRAGAAAWNNTFANADTSTGFYWTVLLERSSVALQRGLVHSVETLRSEDVRRVAARCFRSEVPRVWVLVGDQTAMEPQLAALGWQVEWVSPEAAFIGGF